MPRDIILLCDGTSNEIASNRTNILRLYGCLEKSDDQIVWYDPGIGTFGSDNAWFRWKRKAAEILGLLTGWGLDQNVLEACGFLIETYRPGDRIWLAGFSRGAYTVRVVAGVLHGLGLIQRTQTNLLGYAYRAYRRAGDSERADLDELKLFQRILQPRPVEVSGLFLFDTVASVIEWGRTLPRLRSHAFTQNNPSVRRVRHALALHERRVMFRPQEWTALPGQDVAEVWFNGSHGDVGGGRPEAESALAKVTLAWMIDEMAAAGLRFDADAVARIVHGKGSDRYVAPDPAVRAQNSMSLPWSLLEIVPARRESGSARGLAGWHLPLGRPRRVPEGARVHRSVRDGGAPLPDNLPDRPDWIG